MKNSGKVDKGFELFYWNLSYRRKLIRTLWLLPLILLATLYVYIKKESMVLAIAIAVILVTIAVIQITYNYRKWKGSHSQR